MRPRLVAAASLAVSILCSSPSRAQTATHVLVIANESVPGSVQIAEEYLTARAIPKEQLLRLKMPATEQISPAEFDDLIQAPIAKWLAARSLQDRILYIVLTKGVPLRITGTRGRQGTAASVDSELSVLYRRLTGISVPLGGPIQNPYFAASADDLKSRSPFNREAYDIYLVTRLDGFTVTDALSLINRSTSSGKEGVIALDAPFSRSDARIGWMADAASRLREMGLTDRVVFDTTERAVAPGRGVLGYVSWGSNDPALHARRPNLEFVPGAIASMFLSSDARTFVEPAATWHPASVIDTYAGTSQTLIADLIRGGVTGVAGQVDEAYLDGAVRPDVLFPAYVHGFNLAESFYLAIPFLSWQTVVIGDPLCGPFATGGSGQQDPDPPLDAETELPARFAARRLQALQRLASPAVLKAMLRAEARRARGDDAGALDALNKAVTIDSSSVVAWRLLAVGHERRDEYVEAAAAYRHILALEPNDIVALNNLAYHLAVRQHQPQEGYTLALQAAALARENPTVNDTLGWIHHLLGDDVRALPLLEAASRALPRNAEVQFHAAVVLAKAGRLQDAAKALTLASDLDPSLKDRADFRELQRTVAGRN